LNQGPQPSALTERATFALDAAIASGMAASDPVTTTVATMGPTSIFFIGYTFQHFDFCGQFR
jgi:hypothetical protein